MSLTNNFLTSVSTIGNAVDMLKDLTIGVANRNKFYRLLRLLNVPIGLLYKSGAYTQDTLMRNVGSINDFMFDKYGTPIGYPAEQFRNASITPNFKKDFTKNSKSNYFDYMEYIMLDNSANVFQSLDGGYVMPITNTNVGVIRNYDIVPSKNIDSIDNKLNNGLTDTLLGTISNYYLNQTMSEAQRVYANSGSYSKPFLHDTNEDEYASIDKSNQFTITKGVYSRFGLNGEYGIQGGEYHLNEGTVRTQSELFGQVIPWSTTDHWYDTQVVNAVNGNNLDTVRALLHTNDNSISEDFVDLTQSVDNGNFYGAFGNSYSITYSLGLTQVSGSKTQEFIAKSMYGYDLLSNVKVNFEEYDNNAEFTHAAITGKKYYVGRGSRGTNYLDKITSIDVNYDEESVIIGGRVTEVPIRYVLNDAGNDNMWSNRALYMYAEATSKNASGTNNELTRGGVRTFNLGSNFGKYATYTSDIIGNKNDIINYTNSKFSKGKIGTLVSRFHTDKYESPAAARASRDIISTAISEYGMSHGRNLLKSNHGQNNGTNGYDNPYCRTWTYHHQYSTLKDTIRPFDDVNDIDSNQLILANMPNHEMLKSYGVKASNGLVRYAPTKQDEIKKCMFSIENLAWKNDGGSRVMWFPPYNLKIDESVSVNWSGNDFIGRGEKIYSYVNTDRSGSLRFTLLIDHPSIVNGYAGAVSGGDGIGDVDDTESNEQSLLRFFAGCDMILPTKGKQPSTPKQEIKVKDSITPKTHFHELVFYVFFPNNYSGVDDLKSNSVIKPIEYLINGLSSQTYKNTDSNSYADLPTSINEQYKDSEGNVVGGYEIREKGITVNPNNSSNENGGIVNTTNGEVKLGNKHKKNRNGGNNYWAYRVDNEWSQQVFPIKTNYTDVSTFQFNSKNYKNLTKYHTYASKYENSDTTFVSLTDMFVASSMGEVKSLSNDLYSFENVETIKKLLNEFEVKEVDVCGFASSHGYTKANKTLSKNRAKTVEDWLKNSGFGNKFLNKTFKSSISQCEESKHKNVNLEDAVAWRCSRVIIKLQKEDVLNINGISNINLDDNLTAAEIEEGKRILSTTNSTDGMTKIQKISVQNIIENNNAASDAEKGVLNQKSFKPRSANYTDDEYQYFEELKRTDPLLHSKIVEKLKYFDPAFHSITPEGFNARLNFLHQCTRQGSTYSASEGGTSNNMSFGAPPICILRLGDFYNTKIIIESMSISYDDTTWDLNDEGIGVMPMMANITMNFKFLGGSDITGPIRKLQNAVTFNYYANTSIYDGNAETN